MDPLQTTATDPMPPVAALALCASFGSLPAWRRLAQAARGTAGGGWLALDATQGRLVVLGAPGAHGAGQGAAPLRLTPEASASPSAHRLPAAPEDGFDADAWAGWLTRYREAVFDASKDLATPLAQAEDCLLVDVRRGPARVASGLALPGAAWREPAEVDTWARDLPAGTRVLAVCVHGHEVSRAVALRLRALGHDAGFLEGGLQGWQDAGRPLAPLVAA